MPLTDLRQYIEALRSLGEIQEIDAPVSLNLELGAIIRRCNETGAPAPLFKAFPTILPASVSSARRRRQPAAGQATGAGRDLARPAAGQHGTGHRRSYRREPRSAPG